MCNVSEISYLRPLSRSGRARRGDTLAGRIASPFLPTGFADLKHEAYGDSRAGRIPGDLTRPRLPPVRNLADCYFCRGTTRGDRIQNRRSSRLYRSIGTTALCARARIRQPTHEILRAREIVRSFVRGYSVEIGKLCTPLVSITAGFGKVSVC